VAARREGAGKFKNWRKRADPVGDPSFSFFYRRPAPGVETHGDKELLELWLKRTGFRLEG